MINKPVIASKNTPDLVTRCSISGEIESPETTRKRVALFSRKRFDLKLLAMTISNQDKTWEIITSPEEDNGEYFVIGFDDSNTYNADIYDKVGLKDKTFVFQGSNIQLLGDAEYLINKTLLPIDRVTSKQFYNWLYSNFQNQDTRYLLYNKDETVDGVIYSNIKSFIMDIKASWAGSGVIGVRRVEFYDENGLLIPLTTGMYSAYATSQYSATCLPAYTFDTARSKTGSYTASTQWLSVSTTAPQRLICVFNTAINISKIVVNNGHNSGAETTGIKYVEVSLSTDEITSTVYGSAITNKIQLYNGFEFPKHIAYDLPDNYVLPAFDYTKTIKTGVKSCVVDIADNWGSNQTGIRRIEFFDTNGNLIELTASDITCYATTTYSSYYPRLSFITALSKVSVWNYYQWVSVSGVVNQRLICVFNTVKDISRVVIHNGHNAYKSTNSGAKNVKVYLSSDNITSTVYGSAVSNSTLIYEGVLPQVVNNERRDTDNNFLISPQFPIKIKNTNNQTVSLSENNIITGQNLKLLNGNAYRITNTISNEQIELDRFIESNKPLPIIDINAFTETDKLTYIGTDVFQTHLIQPKPVIQNITNENISSITVSQSNITDYADVYYSMSFDNKNTYKVWFNSAWRIIATNLDSIHGVTGDTDYYVQNNSDVWVTTESVIPEIALNAAMEHSSNRMVASVLNSITALEFTATGGYSTSVGYLDIAVTAKSTVSGIGEIINSVSINDNTKNVMYYEPINLHNTALVTNSKISWSYPIISGFDFETSIQIYVVITGQTEWVQCSNGGAIPYLSNGVNIENKYLYIKMVTPKLSSDATVDPAMCEITVQIQ